MAFKRARAARQAVFDVSVQDDGANYKLVQGLVVEEWEDEDGALRQEAVDGGTTATVIALVDGATLGTRRWATRPRCSAGRSWRRRAGRAAAR